MASRPRTPTFRPQLSVRRVYETFEPRSEMKETPEAYLLHVYLPGFTKDRIKITFVGSSQMMRITGERQFGGNRWSRFDQTYPVPENGDAETLEAKFELGTLILKIQKKLNSQVEPKQEVEEKSQEKSPLGPPEKAVVEAKPEEKAQEISPPIQSTPTKVEEPIEEKKSASNDLNAQKGTHENTSPPQIPSEPIRDHSPQKDKEEIEPKSTPTKETKIQTNEKSSNGPLIEEAEPKSKPTTLTTFDNTVKEQLELKKVGEEQLEEKKVSDLKEKEIQTRKLSAKEEETYGSKVQQKEKDSSSKASPNQEGKNYGEDNIFDVIGNGIRNLAASSSEIVTRIAERKLNDEEKHLAANIGLAVLVIAAWGAYASYKFVS